MHSTVTTQNVDVWDTPMVGGRKIGHIPAGTKVTGAAPSNGWAMINYSIAGRSPVYTKVSLLPGYKLVETPPPPPPDPSDPPNLIIAYWADGRSQRYVPE